MARKLRDENNLIVNSKAEVMKHVSRISIILISACFLKQTSGLYLTQSKMNIW